jgi:hypothetical protein
MLQRGKEGSGGGGRCFRGWGGGIGRGRVEGAANEWTREARSNRGEGGEGKRKRVEGTANEWKREARSNKGEGGGEGRHMHAALDIGWKIH